MSQRSPRAALPDAHETLLHLALNDGIARAWKPLKAGGTV